MTSELKPCPFCGNKGDGPIEEALHVSMCEHDWRGPSWSVQCDNCTATMGYSDTEDEAIFEWNTRAVPDVPELETVGYAYMNEDGGLEYAHSTRSEARKIPLVLRNQAAAVIADERQAAIDARNLLQYEKDQQWKERALAAEAKIATKDAEIEQVKKEISTILVSYMREHFFANKTFQPLDNLIGQIVQLDIAITITRDFKNRAEAAEAKLAQYEAQEPVAVRHGWDGDGFQYIDNGSGSDWKSRKQDGEFLYAAPVSEPNKEEEIYELIKRLPLNIIKNIKAGRACGMSNLKAFLNVKPETTSS